MNNLSDYLGNRDNNFNIMRFIAAALVLFSHSFDLYGILELEPLGRLVEFSFGSFAVDVFFITSGFLIAGSFYSGKTIKEFTKARLLRIYPALVVAVLFTVLVVGVYFTTQSISEYFTDPLTKKYVVRNSILIFNIKYFLPGVFENVPYASTVNGSLWTLPYEIKCYAILAMFGFILSLVQKKLNRNILKRAYLILAVGFMLVAMSDHYLGFPSSNGYRLFAMFFGGACMFVWRDRVVLSHLWFGVMLGVTLLSMFYQPIFPAVYLLSIIYIVLYLAYVPSGVIRSFNNVGDYSYGIYIYAFPIQQSIMSLYPDIGFSEFIGLAFAITLILAILSWHGIEKRCLKFRYKSVKAS